MKVIKSWMLRAVVLVMLPALALSFLVSGCGEKQRVLKVANDTAMPPFGFYNRNKKLVGFDVDFMQVLANEAGLKYEFVVMPFGEIVDAVAKKKVDIGLSSIYVNEERKRQVDFTIPYAEEGQSVLVRRDFDGKIAKFKDTLPYKTCVQGGSIHHLALERLGHQHLTACGNRQCDDFFNQGKCDLIVRDHYISKFAIRSEWVMNAKLIMLPYRAQSMAIAVNFDDKELLNSLNEAIKRLEDGGKLMLMREKWLGDLKSM